MRTPADKQQTYLFLDPRHIRCGDLVWCSPEGKAVPLINPPEPEVELHASPGFLSRGIRLLAQPAQKTEPIEGLTRDVIFADGVYRAWSLAAEYPPGEDFGGASKALTESVTVRCAESKDGFEWKDAGLCTVRVPQATGIDGATFFVDPNAADDERYKAVYMAVPPQSERPALWTEYSKVHPRHRDVRLEPDYLCCMYGLVSPDGVRWSAVPKPLMIHKSDTDTSVYYDSALGRYVMYTRLYWQDRRWIARAETEDFRRWGPVSPLIWPRLDGPLTDDVYTNGRTEYPGLPMYHLMFPAIYHRAEQTSETRLYTSADGICWSEIPGGAVIAPGEAGAWDSAYLSSGKNLVPLGNDRIGVPYTGTRFAHKYPRWTSVLSAQKTAWACWPKGRLCAVAADGEGEFFTPPLTPAGRELRINLRTRNTGEIRVGILRSESVPPTDSTLVTGNPLGNGADAGATRTVADCDPLSGDSLAKPVHWNGNADTGAPEGGSITLHFKLRAAELFGFEWI